jgi:DMSO/TMAO reductase YedYZ molybdopterin-dependent catalytic subunit
LGGLVDNPMTLSVPDLMATTGRISLVSQVSCPDGIGTAGAVYEGVPIESLLDLAGVQARAQYVCVGSGPFAASFAIESLDRRQSILATLKNGEPLTWEDGGPVRLVVAKGACFDTVKWVERLSIDEDSSGGTALSIIKSRRAARLAQE